jgi:spore maturation protein CgeB
VSRILIIGNREGTNIAGALERAARTMSLETRVIESKLAMQAPVWVRRANWWLRGKRPTRLGRFSAYVVEQCREWKPHFLIAVGIAPLNRHALEMIGRLGIRRLDYLTDDPWNPAHRADWFLEALAQYDVVFSTRRSNLADLRHAGAGRPLYLPFAYCPDLHFPQAAVIADGEDDVIFAGGCDRDRVPVIASLIQAGLRVGLYGSLWDRFKATRPYTRGQADIETLRRAHRTAKIALCLPRHANRDGHTMRTFELAAMGACVLAEYTEEHREILGEDGDAVVYFRSPAEMLDRARWLLAHDEERKRLMTAVYARITARPNAYKDRLEAMLTFSSAA